jgi:hypothetical protein
MTTSSSKRFNLQQSHIVNYLELENHAMKIKLDRKYDKGLINLLCYFAEDPSLSFSAKEIRKVVQNYISIFDEITVRRTIFDCMDVLSEEGFQYEWIENMLGFKFGSYSEWKGWLNSVSILLKEEALINGIW